MYHWIIKPDVMECHVSSFLGPQTHPQLSPDEAGLVLRSLRDQGEDCPKPEKCARRRAAGPPAHEARQHAHSRRRIR